MDAYVDVRSEEAEARVLRPGVEGRHAPVQWSDSEVHHDWPRTATSTRPAEIIPTPTVPMASEHSGAPNCIETQVILIGGGFT